MSKPKQLDLEEAINKAPQRELADVFTGELFTPKARNHYEDNDGVPVAPPVQFDRPTIRQRIENLLNRDPDMLRRYLREGPPDGQEGIGMDVEDDPESPLTQSEQNFIDVVAGELAEAAPLPDEGLPRPDNLTAPPVPQTAPAAPGGGPGAVPAAPLQPPAAPAAPTVPTR